MLRDVPVFKNKMRILEFGEFIFTNLKLFIDSVIGLK